jgi:two-component system, chemotaxis family, response regulator Rcp1
MKTTILYVEDDPNDALCFERALKKSGLPLELHIAPDGLFAIEYLKGEDQYHDRIRFPLPQIIVTDMKMYRMNGIEFLHWVRTQPQFCDLPVVLYSTSNENSDVSTAAATGATAYFRKTYQCLEIIEFLREWLESGAPTAKQRVPQNAEKRAQSEG